MEFRLVSSLEGLSPSSPWTASGFHSYCFGTLPCRSLECQAKYSAQGKARPPFFAQKPWSGPMEKLRSVYVFLLSPNRQHERTVGHLEVSRTKNQITRLAFQVFKTTMFRKIPPGGFPGRKNKNNSTSVTQRRPHQQKM